jgi:hypothetical protein
VLARTMEDERLARELEAAHVCARGRGGGWKRSACGLCGN